MSDCPASLFFLPVGSAGELMRADTLLHPREPCSRTAPTRHSDSSESIEIAHGDRRVEQLVEFRSLRAMPHREDRHPSTVLIYCARRRDSFVMEVDACP